MIRAVIFDYGRTLYDRDENRLFPDAVAVIRQLSTRYRLAIVYFSPKEEEKERISVLEGHGILECFEDIQFTDEIGEKGERCTEVLRKLGLGADEIAVVDDHIIRGVAWGNQVGATTIWFRLGKFANVLPDETTGQPDHIVHSLQELLGILA